MTTTQARADFRDKMLAYTILAGAFAVNAIALWLVL